MTFSNAKNLCRLLGALSLSMLLVACGGGVTGDSRNFIIINDQTVIDLNEITLAKVSAEQSVCVVIYEAEITGSTPRRSNTVIAKKSLSQGESENVNVRLVRAIKDNVNVMFAQLHEGDCATDDGVAETSAVISLEGNSALSFTVTRSNIPYIQVKAQNISNESLIVDKVIAAKNSWIVIHLYDETEENNLGEIVGQIAVAAGHQSNVAIQVKTYQKGSGLRDSDEVVVALYEDDDSIVNEGFDVAVDKLIGNTLSSKFVVTLDDGLVHFELNANSNAYLWDGDETAKSKISNQENPGNEEITLTVGERYQINNPSVFYHPFELLSADNDILLSQASIGEFENDAEVNWTDNSGLMTFTLTQSLADRLSKYKCSLHSWMNGVISIAN